MILYYVLQEFWISRIDEWCAIGCPKNLQPKGGLQQHVHDSMSYQISADTTGTYNPDSQRYSGSHDPLESNTSCAAESPKILLSQGKLALPWIQWTDPRTSQVIQWLDKHPTPHQMLFSDSLSVVREENRPVVRNTRNLSMDCTPRIQEWHQQWYEDSCWSPSEEFWWLSQKPTSDISILTMSLFPGAFTYWYILRLLEIDATCGRNYNSDKAQTCRYHMDR